MQHKMVLKLQTRTEAEWQCPVCQRHVRLSQKHGLKVLYPGDQEINHGSATTVPGLVFGKASVSSPTRH